ncbi:MAG: nucleotidyl transferase AbiEii/AbiGii toxin family protein [Planctomycetaceae bacterium]|nr:nucleotidyl transferase AbiEii/AbiGii toxin family protein [Planctomycetaceae bacterium]MCB9938693.1 nucleotidyl transferase AbiEii/AbiGii toxin family protein [Planctomycetaceae bacterium]
MFPVEAFRDTLAKAVAIFRQHAIRFHLTGELTSVVYGEPRMTQDIDIVIDNQAITTQLNSFISSLDKSDFLFDSQAIRQAVEQRGMFQLFDNTEALKLDIYSRELIEGELNRSQVIEVFDGMHLPVASRADAAASKLVWISKGSHKSRRDLRHVYRGGLDTDRNLVRELAVHLGLESLLDEVLSEPDEIRD